jgi:hypothetical protein
MVLYPKAYFKSVCEITVEFLKQNNIKALILDVDNTLIDYYKNLADDKVEWAENLKNNGIKLYILSNTNKEEKVKRVAEKLQIPYEMFAQKPSTKGFKKIQAEVQENAENIGVVGDQIFTDIIGGNRSKMFSILVDPVDTKDYWYTAWKRPMERWFVNRYVKKEKTKEKK